MQKDCDNAMTLKSKDAVKLERTNIAKGFCAREVSVFLSCVELGPP